MNAHEFAGRMARHGFQDIPVSQGPVVVDDPGDGHMRVVVFTYAKSGGQIVKDPRTGEPGVNIARVLLSDFIEWMTEPLP